MSRLLVSGVIDWHALWEVVYASIAIVIVVSFAFSLLLYGAVRSADQGRAGNRAAAIAFGALASLGALAVGGVVAYGFYIIIDKK